MFSWRRGSVFASSFNIAHQDQHPDKDNEYWSDVNPFAQSAQQFRQNSDVGSPPTALDLQVAEYVREVQNRLRELQKQLDEERRERIGLSLIVDNFRRRREEVDIREQRELRDRMKKLEDRVEGLVTKTDEPSPEIIDMFGDGEDVKRELELAMENMTENLNDSLEMLNGIVDLKRKIEEQPSLRQRN
ncbi:hypothetical protein HK102_011717 [Quaeritorhiza haematococci]|nr:hypothetical protein HK102_011717 [Quaeritorhiza haematococci]